MDSSLEDTQLEKRQRKTAGKLPGLEKTRRGDDAVWRRHRVDPCSCSLWNRRYLRKKLSVSVSVLAPSNNKGNEEADRLANDAARAAQTGLIP